MIKEFFRAQVDYIYFVHGFVFFLLAWICFILHSRKNDVLPWKWLGLFGLIQGLNLWSHLVLFILDYSPFFNSFRFFTAVASYILGILGCLWLFLFILRPNKTPDLPSRRLLGATAVIFSLYALASSSLLGLPVELVQAFLVLCLTAVFWAYRYLCENIEAGYYQSKRSVYFFTALAAFTAVLISGYLITDSVGNYYKDRSRNNLLVRVNTIASTLDQGRIRLLSGSSLDISSENYAYLKRQIESARLVNRDCRFLYLLGIRDKKVFFFLDSLAVSDQDYSPPGEILDEADAQLVKSFSSGMPFVEGPAKDRWGEWVSGLCPVKDSTTGEVIAVLGMDVDAKVWRQNIFEYRMIGIFAAFILLIVFLVILQLNETYFAKITVSKVRFDAVMREMGDGVITCTPDYRITAINPAANKYLGIAQPQGRNLLEYIFEYFAVSLSKNELTDSSVAHKTFDIIRQETELFRPLYLEVRLDMLKNLTGETSGIVMTLRDVTEVRTEEMMKQDFLGLISHKLRTPIAVISDNAAMLKEELFGPANDKQKEVIASILKGSGAMTNLINKLLKFVEIGQIKPGASKEKIDFSAYVSFLVNSVIDKVKDKKIALNIDCPQGLILNINKSSLEVIIKNLVENALKFNDKEITKISISAVKNAQNFEIRIQDNGPGIPAEDQEKIFGKFYQIEKFFTGNIEGAGLGLALVRRLVNACGGKIALKSEITQGTTFIISLPQ